MFSPTEPKSSSTTSSRPSRIASRVERRASSFRHKCAGAVDGDPEDLRPADVEPERERHEDAKVVARLRSSRVPPGPPRSPGSLTHTRGRSSMARVPAFQAGYAGSIPVARSQISLLLRRRLESDSASAMHSDPKVSSHFRNQIFLIAPHKPPYAPSSPDTFASLCRRRLLVRG